jgi:hypothetical protein
MKKFFITLLMSFVLFSFHTAVKSQVLISLLLGDKLNTGKIEFGLDGGVNWLTISNTPKAKHLFDWNLGFYFDFKMKNPHLIIHTGVLVKSKMGTKGLDPYSLGNDTLDKAFAGGTVERKLNYFNVPVMLRYRFDSYFHLEGGVQLGLRYTGYDVFYNEIKDKDDLSYLNDVADNYTRIDAGVLAGVGHRFNNGEGMILSLRFYYGFVDADRVLAGNQNYSAIYITGAIPIGKGKAEKKAAEKAREVEPLK